MVGRLTPYPAYKDSGLPWLGQVPGHWEMRKLRHCAAIVGGLTPSMSERAYWDGTIPWVTPKDMKSVRIDGSIVRVTETALAETSLKLIHPPAILIVVRGMILARRVPIAATLVPVTINQDMKALLPRGHINERFLTYAMQAAGDALNPLIDTAGHGTKRLPTELWRELPFAIPPTAEQTAIADFLDRHGALVRRYIRNRRRLIELLNERKQAIITQAVTRGLDPSVPLKPSGIDWLGDLPAHWEVRRLRNVTSHVTSGSRSWSNYAADDGPLFVRVGNLTRTSIDLDFSDIVRLKLPSIVHGETARTRIEPGDLLLSITAYIGSVAIVPDSIEEAYVSQHVACCRLIRGAANPQWLGYVLLSSIGQIHGSLCMYGGTKQGLSLDDVKNHVLVLPPREEQDLLVQQIKSSIGDISQSITLAGREIELIREYRERLIADVVTGKLDVRGVALPDVGEDEAGEDTLPDPGETEDEADEPLPEEAEA